MISYSMQTNLSATGCGLLSRISTSTGVSLPQMHSKEERTSRINHCTLEFLELLSLGMFRLTSSGTMLGKTITLTSMLPWLLQDSTQKLLTPSEPPLPLPPLIGQRVLQKQLTTKTINGCGARGTTGVTTATISLPLWLMEPLLTLELKSSVQ